MERKSPARSGRPGPSAMCVCETFSTIVCPIALPPSLSISAEQVHQICHVRLLLQRPNRRDGFTTRRCSHYRLRERLKLFFDFLIRQGIARIAFGIIQLPPELATLGGQDGYNDTLQCRENLLDFGIGYYFDFAELLANERVHDLFPRELQRRDLALGDGGRDDIGKRVVRGFL